jgi:hypothetical protein
MAEPTGPTPEQLANAAKLVESSSAYLKELKKVEKAQKDLNNLYDDANTIAEATVKLAKEREKLDKDALAIGKLQEENLIARKKTEAEIAKQSRINKKEAKKDRDKRLAGLKILQENLKGLESETQTYKEQSKLNQKALRDLDKKSKTIQKNIDLEEKYGKEVKKNLAEAEQGNQRLFNAQAKIAKQIPGIGGALGKALDMKTKALDFSTNIGKLGAEMAKLGGKAGDIGKALEGASKHMTKFFEGIGLGSIAVLAFVGYLVKMALDVNNLSKELGASTGFGDKFNSTITAMGQSGHMAGIGFKESAAALKGLTEGLSSFNPNAEDTNAHLGMTVARLEKLGVSSGASVKSIDHMQRAMGMTAKQAADTTAQVARMGKEIGITGTKMINDFNAASGRLAIYGKENIKVFKELAAQAKATGIEMGSLLNISSKFDKFDSAAESVGQLNAVLGTQLSTIEMINASDSEKIMLMKQEVQASVGNFDALDKHTKQYIAHAMGVKDVAEAQRLLNMSNAEYEKYQKGQKESADIQKEMADATEKLVPVMQQLKLAAMQVFMAFAPFIDLLAGAMTYLGPIIGWFADLIAFIAPAIAFLFSMSVIIAKIFFGASALAGALNPVTVGILAIVSGFTFFYQLMGKKINPTFVQIFNFLAESLLGMLNPLKFVTNGVKKITGAFTGLFKSAKKDSANMTKDGFDIKAMATMDTAKISAGIKNIKSAVMELSSVKIDGFLAMKTDGTSSSFVMGSDGLIKSISEGTLTVDVKMPEINIPPVTVNVYVGNSLLKTYIDDRISERVGRSG